jgi:hypothetical protein
MLGVPGAAISLARMVAVNWVPLTTVVARGLPLTWSTEVAVKLVPVLVRVKAAPPAIALLGLRLASVGTGLTAVMVKARALEIPPPGVGVTTVMLGVPTLTRSLARMVAVSCVALTKLVVRLTLFHCTTEAGTKFVPVTVRMKAGPPCGTLLGLRLASVGTGLLTASGIVEVVPPPGAGDKTVMLGVPALAMSAARMPAVSWVALTKLVVRLTPFTRTTDVGTKPVPVTVRVKAGPPCEALLGESVESVGAGLLTLRGSADVVPPPGAGVTTVMLGVPALAISVAKMLAVSWVALTNVVARGAPPIWTPDEATKLVPVTVRVEAGPPAVAVLGLRLVSVGAGLLTLSAIAALVPPPGAGVKTVRFGVPGAAMSLARMVAVNWVALTTVVARGLPLT